MSFEWAEEKFLTVDESDATVMQVIAHPGLSEQQVAQACDQMDRGPEVLGAWRTAVRTGISSEAR